MSVHFKVVSDSMSPLIKINDQLVFSSDISDLTVFDIVLFKRKDQLVVHFVWRNQLTWNNTIITRSLKNYLADELPVEKEDIIGAVSNYKIPAFTKLKIMAVSALSGKT